MKKPSREEREAWKARAEARVGELREHERRIREEIEERRRRREREARGCEAS
jgi:hypothetical protein